MADITYTSYEAARVLGVSESTIRLHCRRGLMRGAYRKMLRKREIWMIPLSALVGEGADDVLQPVSEGLEGDQFPDPI